MRIRLQALILALAAVALDQPASSTTPTGNPFFDGDNVHAIWLTIDKADWWETLDSWHRQDKSDQLEADLGWNTTRLARVGVRFKGNSSYNHPGRGSRSASTSISSSKTRNWAISLPSASAITGAIRPLCAKTRSTGW